MKKLLTLVMTLLLTAMAYAQEVSAPDYRAIRQSIQNNKSPLYYPQLMRRYMQNDTTLTLEHYRALYYGYTLQEDYIPYQREHEDLYDVRRRIVESKGDRKVCSEAIKISQAAFDDNPFDLLAISTMAYSFMQLNDTVGYNLWNDKQNSLLDAIVSTGDGDEPASAFHVISIEHEYEVLNRLGLQIDKDSLCSDKVEYLKVLPNAEEVEGLYFNFGACRQAYAKRYE